LTYPYEYVTAGSGGYINDEAGEALGKHKLVYRAADDTWKLADADAAATMYTLGLTLEDIGQGMNGKILFKGYVADPAWAWTRGGSSGTIYASATPGELTQTPPPDFGDIVQPVAVAFFSTGIWFDPNGIGSLGSLIRGGRTTLVAGDKSRLVPHGFTVTPRVILLTAIDEVGGRDFYVPLKDAANFTLEVSMPNLTDNLKFYWLAMI